MAQVYGQPSNRVVSSATFLKSKCLSFGVALLLMSQVAWSFTAGPGDGGSAFSLHDYNPAIDGWEVSGTVSHDPNAGPWLKILNGTPIGQPVFFLWETITVGPGDSWTDWHEEILTTGWDWGAFTFDIDPASGEQRPNNFTFQQMPATPSAGGMIWFFFDALAPGTVIDIHKELIWVGGPNLPAIPGGGSIVVAEYPTVPIPGAALLFAPALLVLGWIGRRNSAKA